MDSGDCSHKPMPRSRDGDGTAAGRRSSSWGRADRARSGMVMVMLQSELLCCPVRSLPLVDNSPIYQCNVGHVICGTCRKKLARQCPSCDAFTVYRRCIFLQNIVDSAKVCCVNSSYGCKELLSLDEKSAHEEACSRHFPCFCPKINCKFQGSKEMLTGHLAVEHNLPVERSSYKSNFRVDISRLTKHQVLLSYDDKLRVLKTAKHVRDSDIEFKCRVASTTFQDLAKNDQFSLLVPLDIVPSVGTLKLEICIKEVYPLV